MKTEQAEQVRLTSQKAKYTLGALLLEYCNWLELQGKGSHREARNVFKNHVQEAAPDLWAAPAALVDRRQINEPVRKLAEAGMRPTARKLRSYLRAAYACAVHADSDANLPAAFIPFGVTLNPVEATAAVKTIGTDKNPLNLQELRDYWSALQDEPGERGAALRLLLLTGAQRVAQLARVRAPEDVRQDAIRILDTKGRRQEPRIHLVPITKAMRRELALLSPVGFVLSTDRGKTPMHATSLSAWASDVGTRAGIQGFQLKRVRSAVETELARTGVGKDIRGQLQSHGLGGIQERHYDAYEYMREKREGVDALYELLTHKGPRQKTAKKALRRKSPVGSEVI